MNYATEVFAALMGNHFTRTHGYSNVFLLMFDVGVQDTFCCLEQMIRKFWIINFVQHFDELELIFRHLDLPAFVEAENVIRRDAEFLVKRLEFVDRESIQPFLEAIVVLSRKAQEIGHLLLGHVVFLADFLDARRDCGFLSFDCQMFVIHNIFLL